MKCILCVCIKPILIFTFNFWADFIAILLEIFILQTPILYCIEGVIWPFQIYCASPNLGIIRTWICQLNFAQRLIFPGLRFFNEPVISDSGLPAWSPSQRTCAQDFYILKKSIDLCRVWTREPWISRQARYPKTTNTDSNTYNYRSDQFPYLYFLSHITSGMHSIILFTLIWRHSKKIFFDNSRYVFSNEMTEEPWIICSLGYVYTVKIH